MIQNLDNITGWKYNQNNVELQLQNGTIFRIEKFRILCGQFDEYGNGNGKIYQRLIDEYSNSKFDLREGDFKNYKLSGEGAQYQGKSRHLLKQGTWVDNVYISSNLKIKMKVNSVTQRQDENQNPRKDKQILSELKQYIEQTANQQLKQISEQIDQKYKALIYNNNQNYTNIMHKIYGQLTQMQQDLENLLKMINIDMISIDKEILDLDNAETWCKYDQNIRISDFQILSSCQWINSAIVDAYATSLNILDENTFWASKDKQQYQRSIVFPSYIMTQYIANKDSIESIKEYLLEYESINYQIGRVFRHICFIINWKNMHWFFARVDLQKNLIQIYDGLHQSNAIYKNISEQVRLLLVNLYGGQQISYTLEVPQYIPKQNNTYECGIMICIYAKWIVQDQMKGPFCQVSEMRQILLEIISSKP